MSKSWKSETVRMMKQMGEEFTIDDLRKNRVVIKSDLKPRILGDFKTWEQESFIMADENGFLTLDSDRLINWLDRIKEQNNKTYDSLKQLADVLKAMWNVKI